jgi:hypothetical protein
MKRIPQGILALTLLCSVPLLSQQSRDETKQPATPTMPSAEEINDLLSKASEYVAVYETTFKNAKPTLDRSPAPGFFETSKDLSSNANSIIATIKKNGMSAYALVFLVKILDNMSLNAGRASTVAVFVQFQGDTPDLKHRAALDMQDISQAGKNCYDISELLLRPTLRYVAVEEDLLQTLSEQRKSTSPTPK